MTLGDSVRIILEFARAEQAGDPFAFRFLPQTYLLRGADGGFESATFDWTPELLADLDAVRRPGRDPAVLSRLGHVLRCFLVLTEWPATEKQILDAVQHGRRVVLTIRSAAAELYALPWELLTIKATGQHLGELPDVLIRYEWPQTSTAPPGEPGRATGRIFVAWSAAGGAVPAAEHIAAIHGAARRAAYDFAPERDVLPNASCGLLTEALGAAKREGRPIAVLHLLAHGGATGSTFGLALDSETVGDGSVVVDPGRLRQLLGPYAATLRLVVLAACDSGNSGALNNQLGSLAQTLHRAGIAAVVASRYPLSVTGSIRFAQSFYAQLLEGPEPLETALLAARRHLAQDGAQLDWASVQLYARANDGDDSRPLCFRPFRGLLAFLPEHGRLFFGRDREIQQSLAKFSALHVAGKPRLLVVAGASGTGKSSLVLAGIVPRLLTDSGTRFELALMRPGSEPDPALDEALRSHADSAAHCLLVVDQFEELFTHHPDSAATSHFVRRLWQLATDPGSAVSVILTLRVDFVGRCGELLLSPDGPRLDQVAYDEAHRIFVAQLDQVGLQSAIEEPADRVGLLLEPGLTKRLLADAGAEPGGLPLIEDTLDLLWQRREERVLTQRAYDAIGGVAGALNGRADALLAGLHEVEQRLARRLLVRLVHIGADPTQSTRRRVRLSTLHLLAPEEATRFEGLVDHMVSARLLVCDGEGAERMVEVAHEALIRKWQRLRDWVVSARKMLAELEKLESWVAQNKEHGTLLTGAQLGYAQEVTERYPEDLPEGARELLQQSQRLAARRKRTRQASVAFLVAVALVFMGLGIFAFGKSRLAERQKTAAETAQRAEAEARKHESEENARVKALLFDSMVEQGRRYLVDEGDAMRALLWLQRASAQGLTTPALRFLLAQAVYSLDSLRLTIPGKKALLSPDASRLLTVDDSGHGVVLWETSSGRQLYVLGGPKGEVNTAAFSPDGKYLAIASTDSGIQSWDVATGQLLESLASDGPIRALSYSLQGDRLIVAHEDSLENWNIGKRQQLWKTPQSMGDDGATVRFSQDGSRVISTATNLVSIRDARHGKLRWAYPELDPDAGGFYSSFDAQTDRIAISTTYGGTEIRDARKGKAVLYLNSANGCFAGRFSPDHKQLATFCTDTAVTLHNADANSPFPRLTIEAHLGAVSDVAFSSPESHLLVTASEDGTALVWDSRNGKLLQSLAGHLGAVTSVAFGPSAATIVTTSEDGTVRLWDTARGARRGQLSSKLADRGKLQDAVTYSRDGSLRNRDGTWMAQTSSEGQVTLQEQGGAQTRVLQHSRHKVEVGAAFSPDGALIVTWAPAPIDQLENVDIDTLRSAGVDVAKIWDVETGRLLLALTDDAALLLVLSLLPETAQLVPASLRLRELSIPVPSSNVLESFIRCRLPLHLSGNTVEWGLPTKDASTACLRLLQK